MSAPVSPALNTLYRTELWIEESGAMGIGYFDYWNDESAEETKEWNILDGDFAKMENYLHKTGLVSDLERCLDAVKTESGHPLQGTGIDLAAGNLWASRHILNQSNVQRLYCLEYSKHRLLKIGPRVLEHYQIPADKAVLVWGSFYDLHLETGSLDFAVLSAALHHADRPLELLREIKRVLKPGGVVLIIGEHRVGLKRIGKQLVKASLARLPSDWQHRAFGRTFQHRSFNPWNLNFMDVEPQLGDHEYTDASYRWLFAQSGFKMARLDTPGSAYQSFVLVSHA
jgi:ubiquinone/menaquinone biosynthesis C-methylase UbiE